MDDITLIIRGQEFTVSKSNLTEYSDYFRAMFSGNYVENEQEHIIIDVLDPNLMSIIFHYMRTGVIDLSEISLEIIADLALAVNFLQITELNKQIEYHLEGLLSPSNWIKIMNISVTATYIQLEQTAAAHGLLFFKRMKPEYIPTIQNLFWYLSHPYIDVESEFDVFKLGHEWIMQNQNGGDALLLILCCLDYKRLTPLDLQNMMALMVNYTNSLAERIIECLHEHADERGGFTPIYFTRRKSSICKKYTEGVYREVLNLIQESIERKLVRVPVVPMWSVNDPLSEQQPHYLYTYSKEVGFEQWLQVAEMNVWGWSVVSWGLTKIVVVCGEIGKGSGQFMKDVKVYDTLKDEWIQHGATLPSRRHAGLAIIEDSLYIVGGVGAYRVVLDTAIVYDLTMRTYRKIPPLPEAIQNPGVCNYNDVVYACGQKYIYRYEEKGTKGGWTTIVDIDIRGSYMVSFRGSIYITQNYFSHLYRYKPSDEHKLEMVTQFSSPPAALCNLGNRLMVFTRTMCGHADIMAVEEFFEINDFNLRPHVLWMQTYSEIKLNDVAGYAVVITSMPPVKVDVSPAHKRYLKRFSED